MPFCTVKEILDKDFYWARTIKVPYLSVEEAKLLVKELQEYLN